MFEVRNIAFTYRTRKVLSDVSFVVSPGEVVGIVGANGAGKTTLLRVLATLAIPDSGLVLADGHNAFLRPMKYRRQIGYLPESVALDEDLLVGEYLSYRAMLKGEIDKRVRRRVEEAVEMCQLNGMSKMPIRSLSLGQKKRVALADALLLRPRVLLLDDFLAGIDQGLRDATGAILSEAAAFSSVIVTGHEVDDMIKWTTRFLVLGGGVVSATIPTAGCEHATLKTHISAALKEVAP